MPKFNFLQRPKTGAALLADLKQQKPALPAEEIRRRMRQAAIDADPAAELRAPTAFVSPIPPFKRF